MKFSARFLDSDDDSSTASVSSGASWFFGGLSDGKSDELLDYSDDETIEGDEGEVLGIEFVVDSDDNVVVGAEGKDVAGDDDEVMRVEVGGDDAVMGDDDAVMGVEAGDAVMRVKVGDDDAVMRVKAGDDVMMGRVKVGDDAVMGDDDAVMGLEAGGDDAVMRVEVGGDDVVMRVEVGDDAVMGDDDAVMRAEAGDGAVMGVEAGDDAVIGVKAAMMWRVKDGVQKVRKRRHVVVRKSPRFLAKRTRSGRFY